MKTITKRNLTLILSLIICTGAFGQAIQVNCNGNVGINGSPSSGSFKFTVNGLSKFTNTIYTPRINGITFTNAGFYIYDQLYYGYVDLYGEYSDAVIKITKGTGVSRVLDAYGPVRINGGSSTTKALDVYGTVWVNGTIALTSDERLKKNITSLEGMTILDKINNIEGKKYKFKNSEEMLALQNSGQVHFNVDTINLFREANNLALDDKSFATESESIDKTEVKDLLRVNYFEAVKKNSGIQKMINDSIGIAVRVPHYQDKETFGLLAQEVIKEFPELVEIDPSSGVYAINYNGFIPVLLEAIKSQQQQINTQQQQIQELKNAIKGTETKLTENTGNIIAASKTTLGQNTPNPFSDNTEVAYYLSDEVQNAAIYIYDMNGRQLKSIPVYSRGRGYITIYGNELRAGMYLYSLITDGQLIDTKRMVLTD